jgi:hypothetical protein
LRADIRPQTSAYKIQTPGNHPEENIQHTEHGESLKSKILNNLFVILKFLCSTANNVTLQSMAMQQTGTVLDGRKFTKNRVSLG